ncbi:MAG: acetyl-CoA carboxylase biotin carboxylase subunit [Myxococcota bacterium]
MFRKVLIANRGEIALRILRACRELELETVAVHSVPDAQAMHVRLADEAVCIGPGPAHQSYLNIPALMAAAEITGADAVHPGYGFLSENPDFADVCLACGLTFIGPTPENMRQWGDKVQARALAKRLGLPLMRGSNVLQGTEDAVQQAQAVGFPVMLKASGGGGGRGMSIVRSASEMRRTFQKAQAEAIAAFSIGDLYCERFIEEPKHIEFQVLVDHHQALVLGERECSIQRRHQKLLEEAPSGAVSDELRQDLSATLRRAMKESDYVSAGTVEFLMDERGNLTFMEMNTRIQVEHPVTELVTGVDLVLEQIRVASGRGLSLSQDEISIRGAAIECRINAENPETDAPSPGLITEYHPPGGPGIRVDDGIYGGYRVPSDYDSLVAKVISFGRDRPQAIDRMKRALSETIVTGIHTNIPLHQRILSSKAFLEGTVSTRFLERLRMEPNNR